MAPRKRQRALEAPDPPKRVVPTQWQPTSAQMARLRVEWAALPAEFREACRQRAMYQGKYLLEILEGTKGKDRR